MNKYGMARLLRDILDQQIEDGTSGSIERERVEDAVTTGPRLDAGEKAVLLLSPYARHVYFEIAREQRADVNRRLSTRNVDTRAMKLAASHEIDKVEIPGRGFTVTLYRARDVNEPLVLLLRLSDAYRQAVNPMTRLRLSDSGGLEWLRGVPDHNGQITGMWSDPKMDLVERAASYELILEPV